MKRADRHDDAIVDLFDRGLNAPRIARALRLGNTFVWRRLTALGLAEENRHRAANWTAQAPKRNQVSGAFRQAVRRDARVDAFASRVASALRSGAPAAFADACLDHAHVVACLHGAGLTLPEIEAGTGVGQADAVAAIRAHSLPRAA